MKTSKNPAKLVSAVILHLLGAILDWLIDILFNNYDKNKTLINKIDKINDALYKTEWHLKYYINK